MNVDELINAVTSSSIVLDFDKDTSFTILNVTSSKQSSYEISDSLIDNNDDAESWDFPSIDTRVLYSDQIKTICEDFVLKFQQKDTNVEDFLTSLGKKICLISDQYLFDLTLVFFNFNILNQIPIFFDNIFSPTYATLKQSTKEKQQKLLSLRYLTFNTLFQNPSVCLTDICRKWIIYPEIFCEICYLLSFNVIDSVPKEDDQIKFIRMIREFVIQLLNQSTDDKNLHQIQTARKSLLLLIRELFKSQKFAELIVNDAIIVSFLIMFISYDNTRKLVLKMLKGNITKSDIIISHINSIIVTNLKVSSKGKFNMMNDLLEYINNEREVEIFSNLVTEIINLLKIWNPEEDTVEFIHKTIDFFIRINADYKTIRNLEIPLFKIKNHDKDILFSLISLLYGFRTDIILSRVPISHVYALNIIYTLYKESDLIDVLNFVENLCDFQIQNLEKMRESDFDLLILNDIKKLRDENYNNSKYIIDLTKDKNNEIQKNQEEDKNNGDKDKNEIEQKSKEENMINNEKKEENQEIKNDETKNINEDKQKNNEENHINNEKNDGNNESENVQTSRIREENQAENNNSEAKDDLINDIKTISLDEGKRLEKIEKLFHILLKIVSFISSPKVVQSIIDLISPKIYKNQFILSEFHLVFIKKLLKIFQDELMSPLESLSLSDVNSIPLQEKDKKFDSKNGLLFSSWIYLSDTNDLSKLIKITQDDKNSLQILISKNGFTINNEQIQIDLETEKWSFLAIFVEKNFVNIQFDNNILVQKFDIKSEIVNGKELTIGGTSKSKIRMGNIHISQNQEFPCPKLFGMGPKNNFDSYYSITVSKPQNQQNFSDVFFTFYDVEVLLPLFAFLDVKNTKGDKTANLLETVFELFRIMFLVNKESQNKFAKSNGFFVIKYLLMNSDPKNLNFDLYLMFYNLFLVLEDEEAKKQIFVLFLTNFDLFKSEEVQNLILDHILSKSFLQNTIYFEKFTTFSDYLSLLFTTNAKTIRSKILQLCFNMSQIVFTQKDFNLLVSCFGIFVDSQKVEISNLFMKILQNSQNNLEKLNPKDIWFTFNNIYHCINSFTDSNYYFLITIICKFYKKIPDENLTLNDHVNLLIRHFSSCETKISEIMLSDIVELMTKEFPELFPLFSYFVQKSNQIQYFQKVTPSSQFITSYNWCLNAIITAVKCQDLHETAAIFSFLCFCSSSEWRKIYETIEIVCQANDINSEVYKKRFLIVVSNYILLSDFSNIEDIISTMNLIVYYLFFKKFNFYNQILKSDFEASPFKKLSLFEKTNNVEYNPVNSTWAALGGYMPEFDKTVDSNLTFDNFICFGLQTSIGNEWKDSEVALLFLGLIKKYNIKTFYNLGIITAAFLITTNFNESIEWFKSFMFESESNLIYLNMFSHRLLKYKSFLSNVKQNSSLFEDFNKSIQNVLNEYSNITVINVNECHSKIKQCSMNSFKKCREIINSNLVDFQIYLRKNMKNDSNISKCERSWHKLWQNLTTIGSPWFICSNSSEEIKWMRSPHICQNLCPMKLKRNKHFDDHLFASFARDTGSFKSAEQMLLNYRAQNKEKDLDIFKKVVDDFDNSLDNEINQSQSQIFVSDCQIRKVTENVKAVLVLYKHSLTLTKEKNGQTKEIFYSEINNVCLRLVIQKQTAFELILNDGKPYFIDIFTDPSYVVNFITKQMSKNVNHDLSLFTKKWVENKMSNFDYLMQLNSLSSRSFNDPSIYPVFPWILSDYVSEKLDLHDKNVFRDLSKTVGALTEQRLQEILQKVEDMKSFGQPAYMYSSYAVCPLSVFLWLIRLEPFTKLHVDLQGGRFDHAARLFNSLYEAYKLITTLLNDYRELIPEFYFSSEFLTNMNHFDLGQANGNNVNDVLLPPWSHNDPNEFIYKMRKALESDYVSENINKWIDLIWGVNSRGKNAELNHNTYIQEIYGEIWDTNITDSFTIKQIKANLNHVGQVPPQLFFENHPVKKLTKFKPVRDNYIEVIGEGELFCSQIIEDEGQILVFARINNNIERFTLDLKEKNVVTNKKTILANTTAASLFKSEEKMFILSDDCLFLSKTKIFQNVSKNKICFSGEFVVASINTNVEVYNHKNNTRTTIPFYGEDVTCLCSSVSFKNFVAGTKSGRLIICSLFEGRKINSVYLGEVRPLLITITPSMGYIVTYAVEGTNHFVYLHNVNGFFIKKKQISVDIFCWESFSSEKGIDYVIFANKRGDLYCFDAFLLDIDNYFIRCASEISSIHFSVFNRVVITILKKCTLELIPLEIKEDHFI
ncbi:Beige/BEACH domain containing protein [Trichomonas vaginalis G3]|uniref:Beige/BEACH domain containing protein n=1 Tax=Trichomonas vaginalis (strain ATCC PRA-98 / G3) TaxID=412133 RepID=A2EJ80_TRIV3|nr:beige/BEACH-related family [Trichomonas vaginalis G3]EAY07312.1 Beige/BEACH domain containing protein [Trichomonas vaginalis G3]KAI5550489.1 beige/BEACH-related family [Trichomonas vaginalis G3]|eukprot:XP_001319535.1 Beige/BEACH domain containing protein [Trichomonas vaginalis G3]